MIDLGIKDAIPEMSVANFVLHLNQPLPNCAVPSKLPVTKQAVYDVLVIEKKKMMIFHDLQPPLCSIATEF
jgi:hypothetical protein